MNYLKNLFTDGLSISTPEILSVYIPGVALLVWFYIFVVGEVLGNIARNLTSDIHVLYQILLISIVLSSVISGILIDKLDDVSVFTYVSLFVIGVITLFTNLIIARPGFLSLFIILIGILSGSSITALRTYLTSLTEIGEGGRIAGGLLFFSFLSIAIWEFLSIRTPNNVQIVLISLLCFAGLLGYFIPESRNTDYKKKEYKYYGNIFYFLIPWITFSLAFGLWNALVSPHPIEKIIKIDPVSFGIVATLVYSLSSLIGGIEIDLFGRRVISGFAFILLAVVYLIYGLLPSLIPIAFLIELGTFGVIFMIFIFVIWGDLSIKHNGFYFGLAFGIFFAGLLSGEIASQYLGPVPRTDVSIVSSLLLVLGVISIYYSEEPLHEDMQRFRKMSSYMREIKKLKI